MKLLKKKVMVAKLPAQKGFILYDGPSMLDGERIICIAILDSKNKKTGNMIQTFIMRQDVRPTEAAKTGEDSSVCGSCRHRWHLGGSCYVNLGHAPLAVHKAYWRGSYPIYDEAKHSQYFKGRKLRMGSYGDPAALPHALWDSILKWVEAHTGYTHQIMHPNFDKAYLDTCMVSADSPNQAKKFKAMGARTFRVAMAGDGIAKGEVQCYADSEGITCMECMICDGVGGQWPASVVIEVHGSRSSKFKTALIPMVTLTDVPSMAQEVTA